MVCSCTDFNRASKLPARDENDAYKGEQGCLI